MNSDQRRSKLEELRKQIEHMTPDLQGRLSLDKQQVVDLAELGVNAAVDADLLDKELQAEREEVNELNAELDRSDEA